MILRILPLLFILQAQATTIAIIDTGFDLDHDFLKPKVTLSEAEQPIKFMGHDLTDNSHLKKPVVEDQESIQDILRYRTLKAKGHKTGLTLEDFEWFKKQTADPIFMEKVRLFKRHSHGTFVAGIALREGENINIFPIRGLGLPTPVVAVEDSTKEASEPLKGKTPDERFQEEIENSLNRVSKKFSKICSYIARRNIQVVNASYGITYKSILAKFREKHREIVGTDIREKELKLLVDNYFTELYKRGEKTISRYPKLLFVFSAGNSGLDNDLYHHYPSRIKLPNTLSVAAMNGDYLASFSNYGKLVDIGAPGVGVLSLLPKVYSDRTEDTYSPASGTSMAAPYIANLAAQIMNANPKLSPSEVKRIILTTGEEKLHLRPRLSSGSIVRNDKALRAASLSKEMPIDEAINLAESNLLQDKISLGTSPAINPETLKQSILDSIPEPVSTVDMDDDLNESGDKAALLPPPPPSPAPEENTQEKIPQPSPN